MSLFATPPDEDGTLPLMIKLTPTWSGDCLDLVQRGVLVTLLDHQPIALGEFGARPAFELKQGVAASFDVTLESLPIDDRLHTLEVWWLLGDGRYSEAPRGELSPWYDVPEDLAHVAWGSSSY